MDLLSAINSRTQAAQPAGVTSVAGVKPEFSVDPKVVARREKILKMLGGPRADSWKAAYEAGKQYAAGDRNAPVSLANILSGLPALKPAYRSNG